MADIRAQLLHEITADCIILGSAFSPLDAIIYAAGYNAFTGPIFRRNGKWRGGFSIKDYWKDGATLLKGYNTHGFPNMFANTGPISPFALFNIPLGIGRNAEWITDMISPMEREGFVTFEADQAAEAAWV